MDPRWEKSAAAGVSLRLAAPGAGGRGMRTEHAEHVERHLDRRAAPRAQSNAAGACVVGAAAGGQQRAVVVNANGAVGPWAVWRVWETRRAKRGPKGAWGCGSTPCDVELLSSRFAGSKRTRTRLQRLAVAGFTRFALPRSATARNAPLWTACFGDLPQWNSADSGASASAEGIIC